jgi:hypothetical protein
MEELSFEGAKKGIFSIIPPKTSFAMIDTFV